MGLFSSPNFGPALRQQRAALSQTQENTDDALRDINKSVTQAQPYHQQVVDLFGGLGDQKQGVYDLYLDSLGVNGQEGYDRTLDAFHQGPGFQFALDQANQNVLRNQAALGGVASGGTLMGLSDRAQQLQNLEFGNWQNRLKGEDPTGVYGQKGAALGDLANLFTNAGTNKAQTRLGGNAQMLQASNSLAGALGQQAMGNAAAKNALPGILLQGLISGASGYVAGA